MVKFIIMLFALFISLYVTGCRSLEKEAGEVIVAEFNNLQWRDLQSEIKEAHIHDKITIKFETRNIPDDEIINIEIWEKTDNVLMDFIEKLQGTVKNNRVEIHWTVGLDFNNEDANFNQEVERNGYTIIDLVFLIKHNDQTITSDLLAVLGLLNIQVLSGTQEPQRNIELVVIGPHNERRYVKTDDDGWARIRNLRRIGDYMLFATESTTSP